MRDREEQMLLNIAQYPELEEFIRLVYQLDNAGHGQVASRLFHAIRRLYDSLTEQELLSGMVERELPGHRLVGPKVMVLLREALHQYRKGVQVKELNIVDEDIPELDRLFLERLHLTPCSRMSGEQLRQTISKGRGLGEEIVRRYCSIY